MDSKLQGKDKANIRELHTVRSPNVLTREKAGQKAEKSGSYTEKHRALEDCAAVRSLLRLSSPTAAAELTQD